MINTIINNELNICYPEDFNVLNEEDLMEVYMNKEISQHARTLLFRTRANIYGITCYTRGPMDEETAALFSEVLASIRKA